MDAIEIISVALLIGGSLGLLIAAFKTSFLWGIGCVLIPPFMIAYLLMYWKNAKNPFFIQIAGMAMLFASVALRQA